MKSKTVTIEKIVNGGFGLARLETGQVILLHNSLPGENIRYSIISAKKNTLFGHVSEIISHHPQRITPPCPYYGECGGCNLQHGDYALQLEIKQAIIEEIFATFATTINPIIPSPQPFSYRQRIRLQSMKGELGFLRYRSNDIVPINECLLAKPLINEVYAANLNKKPFQHLNSCSTEVEFLYDPTCQDISILYHFNRKPRAGDLKMAKKLLNEPFSPERIFFTGDDFALTGPVSRENLRVEDKHLTTEINCQGMTSSLLLSWEVAGFCQVNLEQNQNMIDFVLEQSGVKEGENILDLFCGMGNFSLPLAQRAGSVLGIEGQGSSIRCAKMNSIRAGLTNTVFLKSKIEESCSDLLSDNKQFNITVLDPPRQGIPHLAKDIAQLTQRKIVYISCDPATLARDAECLERENFKLKTIQPFDMFPQTHHIESVAIFEKN